MGPISHLFDSECSLGAQIQWARLATCLIQKFSERETTRKLFPPPVMFSTLQEYHQAMASATWMVLLSIIPQDLVRLGAILLGGVICICNIMHVTCPQNRMKKLQHQLQSLEGKLQDAVKSGIMCRSDTIFTAQIARNMGRWELTLFHETTQGSWAQYLFIRIRYRTFELQEKTLLMSRGILQEIQAFWEGHSHDINECIWDVEALERDLEVSSSRVLHCPTYFIQCADKPCKNSEEPLSFVEVMARLNAYQKSHDPSLSHFINTLSLLCFCFRFPSNSPDENHIYHHLSLVCAFVAWTFYSRLSVSTT